MASDGAIVMSPIKVIVKEPPRQQKGKKKEEKDGAFNDTIFLIDLMRQQKQKEAREAKEKIIREMALEQKRRKEEMERGSRGALLYSSPHA